MGGRPVVTAGGTQALLFSAMTPEAKAEFLAEHPACEVRGSVALQADHDHDADLERGGLCRGYDSRRGPLEAALGPRTCMWTEVTSRLPSRTTTWTKIGPLPHSSEAERHVPAWPRPRRQTCGSWSRWSPTKREFPVLSQPGRARLHGRSRRGLPSTARGGSARHERVRRAEPGLRRPDRFGAHTSPSRGEPRPAGPWHWHLLLAWPRGVAGRAGDLNSWVGRCCTSGPMNGLVSRGWRCRARFGGSGVGTRRGSREGAAAAPLFVVRGLVRRAARRPGRRCR
ncbi:hypothetical protein ABH931_005020 [Streptacidiphilus sp. MAP12-33]